ncbi:MAG: chromate transporter [Sulfolobales archaeon]
MAVEHLFKDILDLFIAFLKAGLIMFGGGHVVIPILKYELVENRKLLVESEFIDLIALTEGVPGPITVKMATFVGYRVAGFIGSIVAIIAVVIPTFLIAFTVITVLHHYYQHLLVKSLLKGIRIAALSLILVAVVTLARGIFRGLSHTQTIVTILLTSASIILVEVFRVEPLVAVGLFAVIGLVLGLVGFW